MCVSAAAEKEYRQQDRPMHGAIVGRDAPTLEEELMALVDVLCCYFVRVQGVKSCGGLHTEPCRLQA